MKRSPLTHPGQALVETALVLFVLLFIILGTVAIVQRTLTINAVNAAARSAVAQAATDGDFGGLVDGQTYVLGTARRGGPDYPVAHGPVADMARATLDGASVVDTPGATITVRCRATPCRRYDPMAVRITYTGEAWVPLIPFLTRMDATASATRASERDQQED